MRRELWHPFRSARPAPKKEKERPPQDRVILGDVRDHASSDTEFDTDWDDLSGIDVLASEFATTTADASSSPIYEPVSRLLQRVRERAGMDVVFIAQFVNGKRLVRHVAADPRDRKVFAEGHADPLEATYCKRVLDGRLPEALPDALQQPESAHLPVTRQKDIRAHIAVPVVTRNGRVFGTLCAYSHQPRAQLEDPLAVLRSVADALARALEQAEAT